MAFSRLSVAIYQDEPFLDKFNKTETAGRFTDRIEGAERKE